MNITNPHDPRGHWVTAAGCATGLFSIGLTSMFLRLVSAETPLDSVSALLVVLMGCAVSARVALWVADA